MKGMLTSIGVVFAIVLLCPGRACAAQPPETNASLQLLSAAPPADAVVAKGKGLEIRRSQLDKEVMAATAQAVAQGRTVPPEQVPVVRRQVLEQLISVRLIAARATGADKAAGKAAAEKRYAVAKSKAGSEAAFDSQLKFLGTTPETLLAKWTEALTGQEVLKRELKIVITDQEAKQFYDENPTEFDFPEMVRARHILISTSDPQTGAEISAGQKTARLEKAQTVLKRARAGEDFAMLALAFSNDIASRGRGGEYTFKRGQMPREVEAAAFSMQANQISDIVTSTNGYHIIKLIEKLPAHKLKLADAMADIKSALTQRAIQEQFSEYIGRLREEAGVDILNENLKSDATPDVQPNPAPPPPGPQNKKPQGK
jgi:parvulin-like peptidyl-prolyl isomerase